MTDDENKAKIQRISSRSGLLKLWSQIDSGNVPNWDSGKAFEYLILRAFELEGAKVQYPFSVVKNSQSIEQIDGVIYSDGLSVLCECKNETKAVNIEPLAKLRNQLLRRPSGVIGTVFSRSGFTEPAITLAEYSSPQTVLLWEGRELDFALKQTFMRKGLLIKYQYAVEQTVPNYNLLDLQL